MRLRPPRWAQGVVEDETRPVRSLPPSKALTGPAPPRRSVCAPERSPSPLYGRPLLLRRHCHDLVFLSCDLRTLEIAACSTGPETHVPFAPRSVGGARSAKFSHPSCLSGRR